MVFSHSPCQTQIQIPNDYIVIMAGTKYIRQQLLRNPYGNVRPGRADVTGLL